MRCLPALSFGLWVFLVPFGVTAQEAAPQPLEIRQSGSAYLDAIRYRNVESDVGYYDPTGAVPRLETGQQPAPPVPKQGGGVTPESYSFGRILLILLAATTLVGLSVLVLRNSGSFALSLRADAQNPVRQRQLGSAHDSASTGPPTDLRAILATADRRRALVMLAQAALARTVDANGVLLQSSWTMRDALRHIPKGQVHLDALRNLVVAGEGVKFGDRDVTEEEFQRQVATIRPLMGGAAS